MVCTEPDCTRLVSGGHRKCRLGEGCRTTKGNSDSATTLMKLCEATLRTPKRKGTVPAGMYRASARQLSPRPALPPMKKRRKQRAGMALRPLQKEAEVRPLLS